MLYIKLFIEREKNTGQSASECPFKPSPLHSSKQHLKAMVIVWRTERLSVVLFCIV